MKTEVVIKRHCFFNNLYHNRMKCHYRNRYNYPCRFIDDLPWQTPDKEVDMGSRELINDSSCSSERSELLLFTTLDLCHGSVTLTLQGPHVPLSVCNCECVSLHLLFTLSYCSFTVHVEMLSYARTHVQTHKDTLKTQTISRATGVDLGLD